MCPCSSHSVLRLAGKQKKARAVTLEEEAALLRFYQSKMQVGCCV